MGQKSTIEWTDATWNPIRGCSRVSEGCRNCYAEKVAYRFSGAGQPYEGLVQLRSRTENGEEIVERLPLWNGQVQFVERHLLDPLKWREPRRIFVNSMSDLFHPNVPDEWIDKIFAVMFAAGRHTFQVLTKRPDRMLEYFSDDNPRYTARSIVDAAAEMGISNHIFDCDMYFPLPNVWLGVSVENQKAADERIPLLLKTPAAVRFISAEPLLGPITFRWAKWDDWSPHPKRAVKLPPVERNGRLQAGCVDEYDGLRMLDWVIVGGESGPGARPMHPDWARSLRDQCQAANVPFFFKQWGEWTPVPRSEDLPGKPFMVGDGDVLLTRSGNIETYASCGGIGNHAPMTRVGKKLAGAQLDGREYREFPTTEASCTSAD